MNELESFDSKEEWYFSLWVEELKAKGIISEAVYQPKPFLLSEPYSVQYQKQLKTKTNLKEINLLGEHSYRADWLIHWDAKAENIFFPNQFPCKGSPKDYPFIAKWSSRGSFFSVIDVKGTFNQNDAWRRFSIDQKWVYQKYEIYVQKVVPMPAINKQGKPVPASALFVKTFLPERILYTDKSMKERKLNFRFILINEFLELHGL